MLSPRFIQLLSLPRLLLFGPLPSGPLPFDLQQLYLLSSFGFVSSLFLLFCRLIVIIASLHLTLLVLLLVITSYIITQVNCAPRGSLPKTLAIVSPAQDRRTHILSILLILLDPTRKHGLQLRQIRIIRIWLARQPLDQLQLSFLCCRYLFPVSLALSLIVSLLVVTKPNLKEGRRRKKTYSSQPSNSRIPTRCNLLVIGPNTYPMINNID